MLTPAAMLTLAAELTDAQEHGDAQSLAAIAWQLCGEAGEDLAEIARVRAACPQEAAPPVAACTELTASPPPGIMAMNRSSEKPRDCLTVATGISGLSDMSVRTSGPGPARVLGRSQD
jgi:hypothetical protein